MWCCRGKANLMQRLSSCNPTRCGCLLLTDLFPVDCHIHKNSGHTCRFLLKSWPPCTQSEASSRRIRAISVPFSVPGEQRDKMLSAVHVLRFIVPSSRSVRRSSLRHRGSWSIIRRRQTRHHLHCLGTLPCVCVCVCVRAWCVCVRVRAWCEGI